MDIHLTDSGAYILRSNITATSSVPVGVPTQTGLAAESKVKCKSESFMNMLIRMLATTAYYIQECEGVNIGVNNSGMPKNIEVRMIHACAGSLYGCYFIALYSNPFFA